MATAQMSAPRSARLSDDGEYQKVEVIVNSTGSALANVPGTAATAALLAARPRRKASIREPNPPTQNALGLGGASTLSAASAGAALAHANRKPVEVWRPEKRTAAAEKAALHVKDFTPPETPQPSSQYSAVGLGAAILAVREQRNSTVSPTHEAQKHEHTRQRQDKALQAATGAYTTGRRRADSAPSEPILTSSPPYALHAAGASHRQKTEEDAEDPLGHLDSAMEASRIRHIANTNAKLYTSSPPVASEERDRQNSLRAAAISMAKEMYDVSASRNNAEGMDSAVHAAQQGTNRLQYRKTISATEGPAAQRVMTLQEAAQRRAAEKLALMHDEHAELQNYYGTRPQPQQRSLLTTRRKRTSSDADSTQMDAEQSRRIRSQMTSLRTKMDQVDVKRTRDRELLMEAARRNVDATIMGMEKKMYADTGRAPPALQREWDEAAQERVRREAEAVEASGARGNRISIGKDQYMDMADVEAVARSRLQPTLDEITENAEQRRAQEVEARLDAEEKQRHAALEREREASMNRVSDAHGKGAEKEKRLSRGMSLLLWRTKSKLTRSGRPTSKEGDVAAQEAPAHEENHDPEAVVQDDAALKQPTAEGAGALVNEEAWEEPKEESKEEPMEESKEEPQEQPKEELASVESPDAPEAAGPATIVTAAHIGAPVSITEPTEYAGRPGMMGRSLTAPRDAAAVGADSAPMHVIHPITSPRADSKLKTWFRDRLIRRSSGPVRVYPHQPGPDFNRSESSIGFTGGAALTGRPESRNAALSSHPPTADELDQSEPARNGSVDVTKTQTVSDDSGVSYETEINGKDKKKKRRSFRPTFLKSASRTDEPKTNGVTFGHFRRSSENPPETKVQGTDLRGLRYSAADQGLPVPPILGETASTGRESRFSEDLS